MYLKTRTMGAFRLTFKIIDKNLRSVKMMELTNLSYILYELVGKRPCKYKES